MKNIYLVENIVTKEKYVGQTKHTIAKRLQQHIATSKRTNCRLGQTKFFQNIRTYGEQNFTIRILEIVEDKDANDKERYWIEKLDTVNNGLNVSYGGAGRSSYDCHIEKEVCELYQEGNDVQNLSQRKNLGSDTIAKIIKNNGIKIDTQRYKRIPVKMIDGNGNEIKTFNSLYEASCYIQEQEISKSSNGFIIQKITEVTKGKRKTAYGYKWEKL